MIVDQLINRIIETKNPTVIGLDPQPGHIPAFIVNEAMGLHNDPLRVMAHAFFLFNKGLIDALCDIVPAVKPQIAFYEQYGAPGIECYVETIRYAREKQLIVIGDIKRGDVASTAQAYADAHLGRVHAGGKPLPVFDTDFVTLNPYLGYDAVAPFMEEAEKYDKGIFVLVKTSNPGAGDIQDIETKHGTVYEMVADKISRWGENMRGLYGYSRIGAVVGATHPEQAKKLRERIPNTFFLVPGYGAQGGSAEDVRPCFTEKGLGAVVNNARGVIAAYRQPGYKERFTEDDFALAAREAAIKMREALGYTYEGDN